MTESEKSREFIPNDIVEPSLSEREKLIDARLEELRRRRESFDPNTEFVGIRRLGSQYTVAEPFAYFDGPSDKQLWFDKVTGMGIGFFMSTAAVTMYFKMRNFAYVTSLLRGIVLGGVPGAISGSYFYDWKRRMGQKKENVFFAYALIHEKDFPPIERKKYNDVIQDFTAHRSLNMPVLGWKF